MKLIFRGGNTCACLSYNDSTKTYTKWNGVGSNAVQLATLKALRDLELMLIKNGYTEEA